MATENYTLEKIFAFSRLNIFERSCWLPCVINKEMDPHASSALPGSHHQGQQSAFSEVPLLVAATLTNPQSLDHGGQPGNISSSQ